MASSSLSNVNQPERADPARIKKITDAVLSLPVLPTITSKLLELVDNPKTSANLLSNLVSKDQVLTAKILKIANSAFYGFSREISTVQRAVVILGFNSLREISLSMSVFNAFKNDQNSPFFNVTEFWKHSIAVGLAARIISLNFSNENMAVAFTAGLLHDLGKMVLKQYLPFEFFQVQQLVCEKEMSLSEAETKILGVQHGQVGGWLASRWQLPDKLVEAITNHHIPLQSEKERDICLIIHVADYLVHKSGIVAGKMNAHPQMGDDIKELIDQYFGISEEVLERLKLDLLKDFELKANDLIINVL